MFENIFCNFWKTISEKLLLKVVFLKKNIKKLYFNIFKNNKLKSIESNKILLYENSF